MIKDKDDIHEFHFRDCSFINDELEKISRICQKSKSGMINIILENNIPLLEKYHFRRKGQNSRYKFIKQQSPGNREKKVVNIHCYMDFKFYKRLKQIHSDLNYYSIAQLLREIIRFFIWLFGRYGMIVFNILKSIRNNWEKMKEEYRKSGKSLRQLLHESKTKTYFSIHYNYFFQVNSIILQN